MATIAENLKKLRTERGLTQEAVAVRIGLTRQAISSYESGRTQPPVDLLARFAEIYGVAIEDILYGRGRDTRRERAVRLLLWVTAAAWLGSFLLCGALSTVCHTLISPAEMSVLYFSALMWVERLQTVSLLLLAVCCALLLILDLGGGSGGTVRGKVTCWAALVLLTLTAGVLWEAVDPVYVLMDLLMYVANGIMLMSAALVVDLAACRIRQRRKRLPE